MPAAGWLDFLGEFALQTGRRRTAIILGGPDSGKSAFASFAARFLASGENAFPVCLVDADVGQSSIGLPGTISIKRYSLHTRGLALKNPWPDRMTFIGAVNPALRIPEMIEGVKRMAARCGKQYAVLVDITGLVSGGLGRALKLGKIKALRPGYVIAIQKEVELEHILGALPGIAGPKIIRFKPSRMAKKTSGAARANYRRQRYSQYFASVRLLKVPLGGRHKIRLNYRRMQLDICAMDFDTEHLAGNIAGLNKGADTLALGVFKSIEKGRALFLAPLESAVKIDNILFGEIFL
ncbi:MAG: polynucleotide 5'-hydroxyl-kinase [Nitrospiraceae bacterium]|nr:polynucleotide 5'-hydroxyl-kinase [Nitrospiraceae bacterium]